MKISPRGSPDLAEGYENSYVCGNFLIRSRIESGPSGPALFYFLNRPDAPRQVPFRRATGPDKTMVRESQ
jgi:hypothetical protein